MVNTKMYAKIQEYKAKGFSIRQTSRELDVDKKTVGKYWTMDEEDYAQYVLCAKNRTSFLEPYREFILGELTAHRESASAIIDDHLRETFVDFAPSYRSVRRYVANLREETGILKPAKIRRYCEVEQQPLGFQAQVDMGRQTMPDMYGKTAASTYSRWF
jgi:hypothetical protein